MNNKKNYDIKEIIKTLDEPKKDWAKSVIRIQYDGYPVTLDIRINNGYDFHDFDVAYGSVEKVINYYLPQLTNTRKL